MYEFRCDHINLNRHFFEIIFDYYFDNIDNISFFIYCRTKEQSSFATCFYRKLVNIVDKHYVSFWPGTEARDNYTLACSCIFNRRTMNVFLNRIVPFMFEFTNISSSSSWNWRDDSYDLVITQKFLYNHKQIRFSNDVYNHDYSYYLMKNDRDYPFYDYREYCDMAIVSTTGDVLFYDCYHEKFFSLLISQNDLSFFESSINVQRPPFYKPMIIDKDSEMYNQFLTYQIFKNRHISAK